METMERKGPKSMYLWNKKALKALENSTFRVFKQLVRMRSPVQIWSAAPENSRNRMISGVFLAFLAKTVWAQMWVNRLTHT